MESNFIKSIKYTEIKDSNEVYHGNEDYISAYGIKKIKKSPLHFKEEEAKETEALLFGSAYHTYILEPELFEKEFYIFNPLGRPEPDKTFASTLNKEWKNAIYLQYQNVIEQDTFELIKSMKDRLFRHKYVRSLLSNGEAEKSIYCEILTEDGFTINVKIRPDYHKKNHRIISDLKTCADASMLEFTKQAANYDYHIQAALYSDIMGAITGEQWPFFFIAQEKSKPYAFNIFEASNQFISQGRYEYEQLLRLYNYCRMNDYWPGYQVFTENRFGIIELRLLAWGINEINYYNHLKI